MTKLNEYNVKAIKTTTRHAEGAALSAAREIENIIEQLAKAKKHLEDAASELHEADSEDFDTIAWALNKANTGMNEAEDFLQVPKLMQHYRFKVVSAIGVLDLAWEIEQDGQ